MNRIRQERTAEQIREILSDLLNREVSDPRLQDLTVTRVWVDRELQFADVYLNALGDESREEDVMIALEKAGGFLRYELAQRLSVRTVPELRFLWDPTLAYSEEVDQILDELNLLAEVDDEEVGQLEEE
ncbi:MAG: 30S ribosome-binding factor RbfA [Candidatus Promineifilaceae bacterium]